MADFWGDRLHTFRQFLNGPYCLIESQTSLNTSLKGTDTCTAQWNLYLRYFTSDSQIQQFSLQTVIKRMHFLMAATCLELNYLTTVWSSCLTQNTTNQILNSFLMKILL